MKSHLPGGSKKSILTGHLVYPAVSQLLPPFASTGRRFGPRFGGGLCRCLSVPGVGLWKRRMVRCLGLSYRRAQEEGLMLADLKKPGRATINARHNNGALGGKNHGSGYRWFVKL